MLNLFCLLCGYALVQISSKFDSKCKRSSWICKMTLNSYFPSVFMIKSTKFKLLLILNNKKNLLLYKKFLSSYKNTFHILSTWVLEPDPPIPLTSTPTLWKIIHRSNLIQKTIENTYLWSPVWFQLLNQFLRLLI